MERRSLLLLIPLLFLNSCVSILSTDTEVTLSSDEKWAVELRFLIPSITGYELQLFNVAIVEQVNEFRSKGVQAEWRALDQDEHGNIPYEISLKGQGYELFNNAIFNGKQVLFIDDSSGEELVHFQLHPADVLGSAISGKVTLHGGQVISTNGVQENNRTVIWTNPASRMEAVMNKPASFPLGAVLLVIGGGVLVIFAIIGIRRRTPKYQGYPGQQTYATYEQQPSGFCPTCGLQLPSQSVFCPNCGAHR